MSDFGYQPNGIESRCLYIALKLLQENIEKIVKNGDRRQETIDMLNILRQMRIDLGGRLVVRSIEMKSDNEADMYWNIYKYWATEQIMNLVNKKLGKL